MDCMSLRCRTIRLSRPLKGRGPGCLLLAVACLWFGIASAQARELVIGYLGLADDPRYEPTHLEHAFQGQAGGRPLAGAEVALEESAFALGALGLEVKLEAVEAEAEGLPAALDTLAVAGARIVLLDLPAERLAALAAASRGKPLLLVNVAAGDDGLRQQDCQPGLLHTAPNEAMLADALAQYLASRKWRKVLALVGPQPADQARGAAFAAAAKRFGLKLVATRPFELSNDPRRRELGNIALLSAGEDYDAVYIADTDGEFARDALYRTVLPRPVVGSAGLVPEAWHWAWERHGAPQLNSRFQRAAGRPMRGADWAAWVAVKGVVEAALRTGGDDFDELAAYLRGPEIVIDGFKGARLSFRPWDGQMRQPLFLTTGNGIAASAPLEGFLHPSDNLDTLGFDEPDSRCRL